MNNIRLGLDGGLLSMDELLEEEHGPLQKRLKTFSFHFNQEWGSSINEFGISPCHYNPLDEPSPLGLKLRKSPSLLDLIQLRLTKDTAGSPSIIAHDSELGSKKDVKDSAASAFDRLKASNFPASHLKIGSWEYVSRHEGDLVAKCYFAKHKLVWEILDNGLKSKIEIQWSDIMALKANCPADKPGNLTIVLVRQPKCFRETNPQPRKHTIWQESADFTNGQASTYRQHVLQCPYGLLKKHYEKLIQCDTRLKCLSQQKEIILDSPYFVSQASIFDRPGNLSVHEFNQLQNVSGSPVLGVPNAATSSAAPLSSLEINHMIPLGIAAEHLSRDSCCPNSGVVEMMNGNYGGQDLQSTNNWEQLKLPGLQPSTSMSDTVNHMSDQMTSVNVPECQIMLDKIAQNLLSDTQTISAFDEKYLMSRVNSLCCLLQEPAVGSSAPDGGEIQIDGLDDFEFDKAFDSMPVGKSEVDIVACEPDVENVLTHKEPHNMSRQDSFSDFVHHLPRMASIPKFYI